MTSTISPSSQEKPYLDLHISGQGRLKRIRVVTPKKGAPYLACDIVAEYYEHDQIFRVRFDTIVSGKKAQEIVRQYDEAVDLGENVRIGFTLGDLRPQIFTRTQGERAGEEDVCLKARLLLIRWVEVNGKIDPNVSSKSNEGGEDAPEIPAAGLHTTGLGYLNFIRRVRPEEGEPYLACSLSALNGKKGEVSYVRFDAAVSKEDEQRMCSYNKAIKAKKKVLVGFELDGMRPKIFTYSQGKHEGEKDVCIETGLARLRWAKVDGQLDYKAPSKSDETGEVAPAPASEAETAPGASF